MSGVEAVFVRRSRDFLGADDRLEPFPFEVPEGGRKDVGAGVVGVDGDGEGLDGITSNESSERAQWLSRT